MRFNSAIIALILIMTEPAISMDIITKHIPDAKVVGTGILSLAFWDIYNATLYAPDAKINKTKPYALSIKYMREIEGRDIADRSVQEIRKQGFTDEFKLAAWNSQMKSIFPNVEDGTVLSAVFFPGDKTIFYQGEKQIGLIKDPEFTSWFSNIWLGEKTSEPILRRRLLGMQ
jgi:Chalcone isomerase-like